MGAAFVSHASFFPTPLVRARVLRIVRESTFTTYQYPLPRVGYLCVISHAEKRGLD